MRIGLKKLIIIVLFIPLLACSGKVTKEESPESLFELGLNYLRGNDSLGIYMNKEKGIALIRRSAEQGEIRAQWVLGDCYYNGEEGVSQGYTQAVYWYRKAAEQGDAEAQYNLGLAYWLGDGISEDKPQAVYWWSKAAEQGNADAIELLKVYHE